MTAVNGVDEGGAFPCQFGPIDQRLLDPRPDQVKVCWPAAGAATNAIRATAQRMAVVMVCSPQSGKVGSAVCDSGRVTAPTNLMRPAGRGKQIFSVPLPRQAEGGQRHEDE